MFLCHLSVEGLAGNFYFPPMNASDGRSFIKWNGIPYQKVLVTVRLVLKYHFIFLYSCWSYVGMIGGRQPVSLSMFCHTVGIAAHELGKCFYSPAVKDKGFVECQKIFNKKCDWLSVHTKMISRRFQNSPLWRAFFKICVFGDHFDMTFWHDILTCGLPLRPKWRKKFGFSETKTDTSGRGLISWPPLWNL